MAGALGEAVGLGLWRTTHRLRGGRACSARARWARAYAWGSVGLLFMERYYTAGSAGLLRRVPGGIGWERQRPKKFLIHGE